MALLVMILRKMVKHKWLELSLLLGLVLAVALVSSMPIYAGAILQRMLIKDLEHLQIETEQYPGIHWSSASVDAMSPQERAGIIHQADRFIQDQIHQGFGLPVHSYVRERETDRFRMVPVHEDQLDPTVNRFGRFGAFSDMEPHIRLVDGRMPANEPVDGVYEALVVEQALSSLDIVLGHELMIQHDSLRAPVIVKPVGVIDRKEPGDLYWYSPLSSYSSTFILDFELFERDFTGAQVVPVTSSYWYAALDYTDMDLVTVQRFIDTNHAIQSHMSSRFSNYSSRAPALATINSYFEREQQLRVMLWSLYVPVLMMLGFYLYMVANLIVGRQKTEIAVLRSRGARRWHIMIHYVIEGVLLGGVALTIGPYVGMAFTKFLGAANGFLSFVQRSAINVEVSRESFLYAGAAVLASLVMTLIPAFLATRTTIVGQKRQQARSDRPTVWHKYFVDLILLGIAIYGLNSFHSRMQDLQSMGLDSVDFRVDPLLFLIPTLFTLGMGLLLLRVYPWFVRGIYWLGRKGWPPALYAALIQVGRSSSRYQFLMVFLIMTIGTGLFSASAARTINQNGEDKIRYKNGADIVMGLKWQDNAPASDYGYIDPAAEGGQANETVTDAPEKIQYAEPPFFPITQLPGVQQAARVYVNKEAFMQASPSQPEQAISLMGIDTDDFGRTAWFKDRLLQNHINDYLNLMAGEPSAVLISTSLADAYGVKSGDVIEVGWGQLEPRTFTVYGVVDYFPSYNPHPIEGEQPMLVVGHLDTIQNHLALEPYEVWIKLKSAADSRSTLIEAIEEQRLPITSWTDTTEELIKVKNDPFQLSINGVMTLGFLISVLISFFGFLLYWILSFMDRVLQLGILRAMGISFRQLIGMLIAEQLLTSGAAILIGIVTGAVASRWFVPLFQLSFDPTKQVPPFEVILSAADTIRLYTIISFMICTGLLVLGWKLSRIKIHQAVKLGED